MGRGKVDIDVEDLSISMQGMHVRIPAHYLGTMDSPTFSRYLKMLLLTRGPSGAEKVTWGGAVA